MTENLHPLTETAAAELWEGHIPDRKTEYLGWQSFPEPSRRCFTTILRAAFDAGREHEREHTDPHHDPRPWQDCTREDIREGDLVEMQPCDRLRIGVAHHKNNIGDWYTEDGWHITDGDSCPLRRIPAPTPPAEEVELPDEPRLLTDVVLSGGEKIAEATWTGAVLLYARRPLATHLVVAPADQIEQWTLDGTRARRDGEHEDGTPRFVKEDA